ncbi:helix-turn-helix transcriptional regulator [Enterobacter asburiae]|uniref:helix-turn-helix transcriptional regulator n=1 Tax=Enterobacter asburiae TaxID=61645 RepID=UPI00192C993C|nr:helix-turn-helix transcriptional regulator [Enterobacter asburiae]MBL5943545.1 helix-turn-helix transcriptional regulator [Enterobacter asburiae]MBL5951984.1 helix-turn-helix transcriptional regulator [Enterobacter asburiae]
MIKILINIPDVFFAYGLKERLRIFFHNAGMDVLFEFGEGGALNFSPDLSIHHFARGEIFTCPGVINCNHAHITIGIIEQEFVVNDLPNCLKNIIPVDYNLSLQGLDNILKRIVLPKLQANFTNMYFAKVGCYNCRHVKLTVQQTNILKYVTAGESMREISKLMDVNIKTLYSHKYIIYRKYGLKSLTDIISLMRKIKVL